MKSHETYDVPDGFETRPWQKTCRAEFKKKMRGSGGSYFTFLVSAGVGSGKTLIAALIAADLLNSKAVARVVFVCPNRTIREEARRVFRRLKVHLSTWDKASHGEGELDGSDGLIMTYSALIRHCEVQGRLCSRKRTLVIFDEIHHLGDRMSWGEKAKAAFEYKAACILGLSGTPFRPDNREIPFVVYEPGESDGLKVFRPDYTYTLGRAINEGVCRKPVFHMLDADVNVTFPDKTKRVVNFKEDLPVAMANRRLSGAVLHGSASRSQALHKVLEFCRRGRLKLIIFVGGDTYRKDGGGIKDATEYLPAELRSYGTRAREVCVVVSDDKESHGKIRSFGASDAWILIAVNMVSEGVDIPELCAALFLTSITARATTIQRIGRTLRGQGEAHIFMFADPRYVEIDREIELERLHEIDLGKVAPAAVPVGPYAGESPDRDPLAIGLNCREDGVIVNGVTYPNSFESKYLEVIRDRGYPEGMAFRSVLFPLIAEGVYGPVRSQESEQ